MTSPLTRMFSHEIDSLVTSCRSKRPSIVDRSVSSVLNLLRANESPRFAVDWRKLKSTNVQSTNWTVWSNVHLSAVTPDSKRHDSKIRTAVTERSLHVKASVTIALRTSTRSRDFDLIAATRSVADTLRNRSGALGSKQKFTESARRRITSSGAAGRGRTAQFVMARSGQYFPT